MANPKVQCRLDPINVAYLDDLVKIGAYGKDSAAVMRRFIENGILEALEKKMIDKRNADDFRAAASEEEDGAD
jgi:hypothetical protein